MLWLWALVLAVLIIVLWKNREGLSPNPYEKAQMHQGEIERLSTKFDRVNIKQEDLDPVTTCIQNNQRDLIEIEKNMAQQNPNDRPDAYPKPTLPKS